MRKPTTNNLAELARNISFPPLKFKNWIDSPSFELGQNERNYRPNSMVEIEWEGKSYQFIVEIKHQATPKILDETIYQLKKYVSAIQNLNKAEKYYPLLIAPYLSEESLKKLATKNISGLDLSRNGSIIVPGKIFVYRFGGKNKFPSNAPIKNVFRGVSSIIPRTFFAKSDYSSVTEILDEITERNGKTTLATVSKVLKTLEEELLISRKNNIRLIDGYSLLKNLRENYRQPIAEKRITGKAEDIDDTLLQMSENADENDFLCAVNEPRRYAVMPSSNAMTKVYTQNIDKLLAEINFSEGERFSNLEIIETQDPTVYFDRRYELAPGYYFTSPLQVYLELANGGKREKETAEQIAEGLLNFRY